MGETIPDLKTGTTMKKSESSPAEVPFEGKMFLYERPELLTKGDHGALGLRATTRPFEFVRAVRAVPLVSMEFSSAQKNYPIVFSDTDIPAPLAVLGVVDDVNLFVDATGNWLQSHYVPSYIRCHPIAFASAPNGQLAVVIDRAAATIVERPDEPFFVGERLTEKMQKRVDFCAAYHQEREKTRLFCRRLKELDLFTGQQVTQQYGGETERSLGTYAAIDVKKLGDLDKDTLHQLHKDGSLSAIYAHIFSLENWGRLLDRRAALRATKL